MKAHSNHRAKIYNRYYTNVIQEIINYTTIKTQRQQENKKGSTELQNNQKTIIKMAIVITYV